MLHLVQLVHVHPGKEDVFLEFEALALSLLERHRGELLLRLRPNAESVVAASMEVPYEVHVIRFPGADDFAAFSSDDDRQRFLHLKNESVRATLLVTDATG